MGNIMGKLSQYCNYNEFLDIYYIDKYQEYKDKIVKDKTPEELLEITDLVDNHKTVMLFYDKIHHEIVRFLYNIKQVEKFLNDDTLTTITERNRYDIAFSTREVLLSRSSIMGLVKDCNEGHSTIFMNVWKIVSFDDIWETFGEGRDLYEIIDDNYMSDIFDRVIAKLKTLTIVDD